MKKCGWCGASLLQGRRWCSKRCRQTAWRSRRLRVLEDPGDVPLRIAYADPPYPGTAAKYYKHEPTYRGEVNHRDLVRHLSTNYDGWALSTSRSAARDVLNLCPSGVLLCPWIKSHHQPTSRGPGNICEFLIVKPARLRLPGPPDALYAAVARGGDSKLMGRKPLKFINWMFNLVGASPVDRFDDLYPGSGIVGRAWREFKRTHPVAGPPATSSRDPGRRLPARVERRHAGDPSDVAAASRGGPRIRGERRSCQAGPFKCTPGGEYAT